MKVIQYEKYGPPEVLRQAQRDIPVTGDKDILIKVHASSISAADWRLRKADPFLARLFNGLLSPRRIKVLGFELSGKVVKTGKSVTRFMEGDEVYATTGFKFGTYAEYVVMNEDGMVLKKPGNIRLSEAAAIPVGANTALHYLSVAGKVKAGQHILIYGASGSVGTYAVQLAKSFGAHVTGVCSTYNIEMVRSLGADEVKDYKAPDYKLENDKYDLIFDAVGKISKCDVTYAMRADAKFVSVKKGTAKMEIKNLELVNTLIKSGKLKPVVDREIPIRNIVEGHRYVEGQHKKGNVIALVEDQFE